LIRFVTGCLPAPAPRAPLEYPPERGSRVRFCVVNGRVTSKLELPLLLRPLGI
jgi:hypothetical protein